MRDGIIAIEKQKVDSTSYQIFYGYNDIVKIEEDNEIRIFSDDMKKWRVYYLPKYDNLIFICIQNDIPYRVLEYTDGMYVERKPDFRDYFLSDFIIEEEKMIENYKYEGDRCIGEE